MSDASSEDVNFDSLNSNNGAEARDARTLTAIRRSRVDTTKRYVFLCPTSMSKHFDVIPPPVKDNALLVFRCSREWFFQEPIQATRVLSRIDTGLAPALRARKSEAAQMLGQAFTAAQYQSKSNFSKEYVEWVEAKEKDGCVFWMKPDPDLKELSSFFERKLDPVSHKPYRPLHLDPQWWRTRFHRSTGTSRYVQSPSLVVANISRAAWGDERRGMDVPALQELIYQSNSTLEPIVMWPHAPSMRFLPRTQQSNSMWTVVHGSCQTAGAEDNSSYLMESACRGFIDRNLVHGLPTGPSLRLGDEWRASTSGSDRLHNLHITWQKEEQRHRHRSLEASCRQTWPAQSDKGLPNVYLATAPGSARSGIPSSGTTQIGNSVRLQRQRLRLGYF